MHPSQTKNWFISHDDVFKASKAKLQEYKDDLSQYAIKLEEFFDTFLGNAVLKNADDPDFKVYNVMLDESNRVDDLLTSINYFQKQGKNWNV